MKKSETVEDRIRTIYEALCRWCSTDLPAKCPTVEALLERADGNYPRGGKKEGIVIRPTEPVYCELIGGLLSMKVVSNKYLLKNE